VVDLYELRGQYWSEQQEMSRPHFGGPLMFFFLGLLALILFIRRRMFMKKRAEVATFMNAIRSNPSLLSTVESQTGLKVPQVCHQHGNCRSKCLFVRIAKSLVFLAFVLFSSFLITLSSLEITASIVMWMSSNSDPNSEESGPSVGVVLLILMSVCAIEIGLFALLVRGIRLLYVRSFPPNDAAPSAPLEGTVVSTNGSNGNVHRIAWTLKAFPKFPRFTFNQSTLGGSESGYGYTPLLSEDVPMDETSHGQNNHAATKGTYSAEMVPTWNNTKTVQVQPQFAIVPITASPVSSVNFV